MVLAELRDVLILGATGQVGSELCALVDIPADYRPALEELDICNEQALLDYIVTRRPRVVLNLAAYTAVDKAEEEYKTARMVNALSVGTVVRACSKVDAQLIHVSTDYVFGGAGMTSDSPIPTHSAVSPVNSYGRTKREGELLALGLPRATVVRTSSVHGQYGANFVATMLRLFSEREEINVVSDQQMSPTWAGWLAQILLSLINYDQPLPRILHASNTGVISWYDFACAIYSDVKKTLDRPVKINAISSEHYPTAAKRPMYSALDTHDLLKLLPDSEMSWREGLHHHLRSLGLFAHE